MRIQLLDNRRLTGPNLFWDKPGAVLDVAVEGVQPQQLISAWREEALSLIHI
mgnify:FL=1